MATQIQLRRDTAANWTSANPTLANGEMGVETDTLQLKTGDGSTAWTGLSYISAAAGSPEGTAIVSTGETIGKVLQADGDNTSSWVTLAGGGNAQTANPLSQFAATTSAQLAGVLSDETGSGSAVFATSPTLVTPALGTPSALVATNATGTASGLTVGATTGVEAGADVTDTANVTSAGALMDTEVTNLAQVKAFDTTDYATAAQGTTADSALQPADVSDTVYGVGWNGDTGAASKNALYDKIETISAGAPEGTAVVSTGETVGKVLQADGDNTSSWVALGGGGDALVANPLSQFAATTAAQLNSVLSDTSLTGTNTGDQTIPATGVDFDPVGTDNSDNNAVNSSSATSAQGATADTALQNISEDTTPQLGGELDAGANSIGFTMQTATGDGTTTVVWGNGNHMDFTFGAFNETFTFTAPAKAGVYTMSLLQDGTGSRTATWPATVKWPAGTAPTLTTTATTGYDIITFRFDGTNYYGGSLADFS
jgi:hypothetical protein